MDRSRENPPISSDDIEWYEPSSSTIVPEQVPYIPYSDDSNPWHLMSTGQSTEHLYRAFKQWILTLNSQPASNANSSTSNDIWYPETYVDFIVLMLHNQNLNELKS